MINLNETNYMDLSYNKVTKAYRKHILKELNYNPYDTVSYYFIVFYRPDYKIYDSFTSDCDYRWKWLNTPYLEGRHEIGNNTIGEL